MIPLNRHLRVGIALYIGIFLLSGASYAGAPHLYDITGRYLGAIGYNHQSSRVEARLLSGASVISVDGNRSNLAAGIYISSPYPPREMNPMNILDEFRFEDVTSDYLPQHLWQAESVQIADLNSDGRADIVFSNNPISYDGITDCRPRVWIQQADQTFVDESEVRIPAVSTPSHFLKLFDADSDGDLDIFVSGYSSSNYYIAAALFINDGAGHFTDESSARLPQMGGEDFAYAIDTADVNNDQATDLIVNVWKMGAGVYPVMPQLWLNDGSGDFAIDTLSRMPVGDYGYFLPHAADINNDGLTDIIFANLQFIITDEFGNPIDTLSGQNACYHNLGDGFFADETGIRLPPTLNPFTRTVALSDIDNDGDQDLLEVGLVIDSSDPQVRLLLNNGDGIFNVFPVAISDSVRGWFNDARFGFLNDDLFPDLFMIRVEPGLPDYDMMLINNEGAMFADSSQLLPQVFDFSVSSALFDHENDSDLDIFIANSGSNDFQDTAGQNVLYHNLLNTVGINDNAHSIPTAFLLLPNYPNPFNARTIISYDLPEPAEITLDIYDLLGRRIGSLLAERQEAGPHSVVWDARDRSSGIYYYRLKAGDLDQSRRCLLLK